MIIGNISTINYDQHVMTTLGMSYVILLPALEYSNDTLVISSVNDYIKKC